MFIGFLLIISCNSSGALYLDCIAKQPVIHLGQSRCKNLCPVTQIQIDPIVKIAVYFSDLAPFVDLWLFERFFYLDLFIIEIHTVSGHDITRQYGNKQQQYCHCHAQSPHKPGIFRRSVHDKKNRKKHDKQKYQYPHGIQHISLSRWLAQNSHSFRNPV